LNTGYNPIIIHTRSINTIPANRNEISMFETLDTMVYTATLSSDPGEPATYKQAMLGPESAKWKVSIRQELLNFLSRNAWKKVPRDMITKKLKRKLITTKWVFKKKTEQDQTICYKSRCVTRGFMQIPGVDCT
jgi:hypothetical protein